MSRPDRVTVFRAGRLLAERWVLGTQKISVVVLSSERHIALETLLSARERDIAKQSLLVVRARRSGKVSWLCVGHTLPTRIEDRYPWNNPVSHNEGSSVTGHQHRRYFCDGRFSIRELVRHPNLSSERTFVHTSPPLRI